MQMLINLKGGSPNSGTALLLEFLIKAFLHLCGRLSRPGTSPYLTTILCLRNGVSSAGKCLPLKHG